MGVLGCYVGFSFSFLFFLSGQRVLSHPLAPEVLSGQKTKYGCLCTIMTFFGAPFTMTFLALIIWISLIRETSRPCSLISVHLLVES